MDRRRPSLVIGSRTRRNVLKGKNIRKHYDGSDIFADYWTDSDNENTSSLESEKLSDTISIPESRVGTLRHVRTSQNSKISHSKIKIRNGEGQGKLTKSPLKSVKNTIVSCDKDVHKSLRKRETLTPKVQQNISQHPAHILSNESSIFDNDQSNLPSNSFHLSVSNSKITRRQTENTAVSPLPETCDKVKNVLKIPDNIQTLKNINKEYDKLNSPRHSSNDNRNNVKRSASPLLSKSNEKEITKSVSLKKGPRSGNSNKYEDRESSISERPSHDNNIQNTSLNTSYIHPLSLAKVTSTEANLLDMESENDCLTDKTLNKINNSVEGREHSSKILTTRSGNHSVKKMRKSCLQPSRTFTKYDEYDAEMMQMAHNNEKNSKMLQKRNYSLKSVEPGNKNQNSSFSVLNTSENVPKSIHESSNETDDASSIQTDEDEATNASHSDETFAFHISENEGEDRFNFDTRKIYNDKTKTKLKAPKPKRTKLVNETREKVGSSETFSRSNNRSPDKIPERENSTKDLHKRNRDVNKSKQKLKASQTFSENIENAAEIPEVERNSSLNLHTKRKQSVNKSIEKWKASETEGNRSAHEIHEVENQTTSSLANKRKKLVNKTHEKVEASETFSRSSNRSPDKIPERENSTQNLRKRNRDLNKSKQKLKASQTFSENIENAAEIPEVERNSSLNLHTKRKQSVNKSIEKWKASETEGNRSAHEIPEVENQTTSSLANKRKKLVNKTHEKVGASETFSRSSNRSPDKIPERENSTQNLHKRNRDLNKSKQKLKASQTFSENIENAAEIPEVENNSSVNLHIKRKQSVNKSIEKPKASETEGNRSAHEIPEVENQTTSSLAIKRKKLVNETREKVGASETFSRSSNESLDKIPERENLVIPNLHERKKQVNEKGALSPGKKRSKKIAAVHATENLVSVRRSGRKRWKPLARWRNERMLYQLENGVLSSVGIDKGTGEDDTAIRQILAARQRKTVKKKVKQKKMDLVDVLEKKKLRLSLVRRFDSIPWDSGFQSADCPYRIRKVFQTLNSASGLIEIGINREKPLQYMPNEDIYLTVIKGKVQVTIQNNVSEMSEKDMFIIPRCIPYSIKNIGNIKALLNFCIGKFEFIESET